MRESKSAFAARLGCSPSYVTALGEAGRLVVVDGKVEVEASLARIDATKDPNRDDVRQRHAKARDAKRLSVAPAAAAVAISEGRQGVDKGEAEKTPETPDTQESEPVVQAAEVFRRARTAKMHYEARRAVVRVARLQGRLTDMAVVRKCGGNDGATLRSMLENLPDRAAPVIAPVRDPAGVARILGELLDGIVAEAADLLTKNAAALREGVA